MKLTICVFFGLIVLCLLAAAFAAARWEGHGRQEEREQIERRKKRVQDS